MFLRNQTFAIAAIPPSNEVIPKSALPSKSLLSKPEIKEKLY